MRSEWRTVSRVHHCPVCGKGDWCGVHADGTVRCMRVPSDHESNGGWIHKPDRPVPPPPPPQLRRPKPTQFDAKLWWETARHVCRVPVLAEWADRLGLPVDTLDWLGGCQVGGMLCVPMHDGDGNIVGIRTRYRDGAKRAITGSRAGVFLATVQTEPDVLICEGPTDACAAMALGYEPLGRPSCTGQEDIVIQTCRRLGWQRVTLCADADGPGIAGGKRMADLLRAARISVRLVAPIGYKDLRDWWRAGARRDDVEAAWSQAKWA